MDAIFFDFDGVIVDSNKMKKDAFRRLFAHVPPDARDEIVEYHRIHGGISRIDKIRYAYAEILHKPLSKELLDQLAQQYSDLVVDKVVAAPWLPGAVHLLERCAGKKLLFLISGTPQDELCLIVERKGISHYFREILGSPVKKPEHIRRLLASYALSAERCVFIGDALTDYNAAVETQMHFIGIQGEVAFPENTVVFRDCRGVARQLGLEL